MSTRKERANRWWLRCGGCNAWKKNHWVGGENAGYYSCQDGGPARPSVLGRKADQVVQPWMHGHMESKGIGLWLRGLPLLTETDNVRQQMLTLPKAEWQKVHYASPGADRWKQRSVFFRGVADAMATQWGGVTAMEAVA